MQIAIRNYTAGTYLLESDPGLWDAIVILDSNLHESDFIEQHSRNSLILRFDDTTKPSPGKSAPTLYDIDLAIQFGAESDRLVVCCRAGQARSAAIAFSMAFYRIGATSAVALLDPKRHSPNSLIIEHAVSIIDDPMFMTIFHEWQTANQHIKLTDYIDELEREMDALEMAGARNRIVEP